MVYLWETDEDFREKFKKQKYFCLPHYKQLLEFGRNSLGKKQFSEYFKQAREIEKADIDSDEKDFILNEATIGTAKDALGEKYKKIYLIALQGLSKKMLEDKERSEAR